MESNLSIDWKISVEREHRSGPQDAAPESFSGIPLYGWALSKNTRNRAGMQPQRGQPEPHRVDKQV